MYYPGSLTHSSQSAFTSTNYDHQTTNLTSKHHEYDIKHRSIEPSLVPSSSYNNHHEQPQHATELLTCKSNDHNKMIAAQTNGTTAAAAALSPLVGSFRLGPNGFCAPPPPHPAGPYGHSSSESLITPYGHSISDSYHHHHHHHHHHPITHQTTSSIIDLPPTYGPIRPIPDYATAAAHHYYMNATHPPPPSHPVYKLSTNAPPPPTYHTTVQNSFYHNPNGTYAPHPVASGPTTALYHHEHHSSFSIPDYMNHHGTMVSTKAPPPPPPSTSHHPLFVGLTNNNNQTVDNSTSFSDHLKMLQESFQSKSSPTSTTTTVENNCNGGHQHTNGHKDQNQSNGETLSSTSSNHQQTSTPSVWNPLMDVSPKKTTTSKNQTNHGSLKSTEIQAMNSSSLNTTRINDNKHVINKNDEHKLVVNGHPHQNGYMADDEPISKIIESPFKRPKDEQEHQDQTEENSTENIKKNKKLKPDPSDDQCSSDILDEQMKSPKINEPAIDDGKDEPSKTSSKKNSISVRRRRFRSGLDMIRNSRKKTTKTKFNKKEPCQNTVSVNKKDTTDNSNNRLDLRRLMVNKSLGETLLHRSAKNNRLDVVKHCLEYESCDVNAKDNAGYTPLHECSSRGNLQVARLLLEHSADVNASATGGIRPLHDAIENNHIELVRLLLSYGADPCISTYSGTTPLDLCRSKRMIKFLKGFYKDLNIVMNNSNDDDDDDEEDEQTYVWKFKFHSQDESGFDIFGDLSDLEQEEPDIESNGQQEFQIQLSCNLLPNLYTFLHKPNQRRFYLLYDVIQTLNLPRDVFISKYPQVTISKISQSDYLNALVAIQLETRTNQNNNQNKNNYIRMTDEGNIIEIILQDDIIDNILDIHKTVI